MASSAEYAVFTEFSPASKPAEPGWNRRVFTDTDVRKGSAIQCDFSTGILTLAPGAYQISGLSAVAYFTRDDPPETIVTRSSTKPTGQCSSCWNTNRALGPNRSTSGVFVENSKWHAFARVSIRRL